ncbi:MAG: hydroxymethylglutaryl-CoA reductase, degradative [Candidatus Thorarchaeota archaeon]
MVSKKTSAISGFYRLSIQERLEKLRTFADLSDEEVVLLKAFGALDAATADRMIENVVGSYAFPLGIATNFQINGKDYLIPMALEEPSVVAAASNAARMVRKTGGFTARTTDPVMIGQIQVADLPDVKVAQQAVLKQKENLLMVANRQDPILVKFGGGALDLQLRTLESMMGPMLIVHLLVDTRDAMGANAVNTMCEALAPIIEELTKGKVYLRILSNLAVYRLAKAEAIFPAKALGGSKGVDGILKAYAFAQADPYRCATHNKGIMNGIDAVLLATGQDFRAIEAGAHTYAATREGGYHSLTQYNKTPDGDLRGTIELPMAVGLVGGATRTHPIAKLCVKILGVKKATELAQIIASVGLAQNLAALRALSQEGIQTGHMKLHARNVAVAAGAAGEEVDQVAKQMIAEKRVRFDRAQEILVEVRKKKA